METPVRKRRRPAVACIECRRRKVKCDRTLPCKSCVHGASLCVYDGSVEAAARASMPRTVSNSALADGQHDPSSRPSEGKGTHSISSISRSHEFPDISASADGFGSRSAQSALMASLTGPSLGDVQTSSASRLARPRHLARNNWKDLLFKVGLYRAAGHATIMQTHQHQVKGVADIDSWM
jgi:hypothetical protein